MLIPNDNGPLNKITLAIFNREGDLLFGKDNSGIWSFISGQTEPGITLKENVLLILRDTTGIHKCQSEFIDQYKADGAHVFLFKCIVDDDPDINKDNTETFTSFQWVNPLSIPIEVTVSPCLFTISALIALGLKPGSLTKSTPKNWRSADGLLIPKAGQPERLEWDCRYLDVVENLFKKTETQKLAIIDVDLTKLLGHNPVRNKARVRLYKRMAEAGEELPPLVIKVDDDGVSLADGNHRQQALWELGKTSAKAVVVYDPTTLKKGHPALAALFSAALMGGGMDTPKYQSVTPEAGIQHWSHENLSKELLPIAELESNGGKNIAHAAHSKGHYHTAYGALGFKPVTAHETYKRSPSLKKEFPGLEDPADFLEAFKKVTPFYNKLATTHFNQLKNFHKDPERAVFAWRHGTGAARNATEEAVKNDPYVIRYASLSKVK